MKKYILLLIIPFLSFGQNDYVPQSQKDSEKNYFLFEGERVNVPIENEKIFCVNNCPEMYEDIKYRQKRKGNTALALRYNPLNESEYGLFFKVDEFTYASSSEWKEIQSYAEQNEVWDSSLIAKLERDIPTFKDALTLGTYTLSPNSTTIISLMKGYYEGTTFVLSMAMNAIYINGKVLAYIHVLEYLGQETIDQLKQENDFYVLKLINQNK